PLTSALNDYSKVHACEPHDALGAVRMEYPRPRVKCQLQRRPASDGREALSSDQLSYSGDALIIIDAQGIVEHLNPVAEQLTGLTHCDAYGMQVGRIFNLTDEQNEESALDHVSQCLTQGHVTAARKHALLNSRSGQMLTVQSSVAPVLGRNGGLSGAMIIFKDVTEEHHLAREMMHHATHDALTGLVNRREFEQRLLNAIKGNSEYGSQHILCYLDLDRFKDVNDKAGHAAGDMMLKQVAEVLLSKLRDRDTLARLGGDEFGLLLDNCPKDKGVEIAQSLITTISDTGFTEKGCDFQIGVSIGLVDIGTAAGTPMELLGQADSACYKAKHLGRDQVFIFQKEAQGIDEHYLSGHGKPWITL
ncbi:diguanylate cyclase domain-containing protein, partial [Pseudomonadota bacterium]